MNASRPTILIIEDNLFNLELATDLLIVEGYSILPKPPQARKGCAWRGKSRPPLS